MGTDNVNKNIVTENFFPPVNLTEEEFKKYSEEIAKSSTIQELALRFPFDISLLVFIHRLEVIKNNKLTMTPLAKKEAIKRINFYKKVLPSSFFKTIQKLFEDLNLLSNENTKVEANV